MLGALGFFLGRCCAGNEWRITLKSTGNTCPIRRVQPICLSLQYVTSEYAAEEGRQGVGCLADEW